MSQQLINVGTTADDHTGEPLRSAGQKLNANFTEIYTGFTIAPAGPGSATLTLNKSASGQNSQILGQSAGLARWIVQLGDNGAESGSNAGSNFAVYRYNDAGALVDSPFNITRSNGFVNMSLLSAQSMTCNTGSITGSYFHSTGNLQVNGNLGCSGTFSAYNINTSYSTLTGNLQVNGDVNSNTSHCAGFQAYGQLQSNTLYIRSGGWLYVSYLQSDWLGMRYPWTGGGNMIAFSWQGDGAHVYIDNAVQYLMTEYSDERLKQGVTPSTYDCLATTNKIPLHQFHWRGHAEPGKPTQVQAEATKHVPNGLVAQELHKVAPHLVAAGDTKPDGSHGTGNPMGIWGVDSINMLALLVGAVQQLKARVEALEAAA